MSGGAVGRRRREGNDRQLLKGHTILALQIFGNPARGNRHDRRRIAKILVDNLTLLKFSVGEKLRQVKMLKVVGMVENR